MNTKKVNKRRFQVPSFPEILIRALVILAYSAFYIRAFAWLEQRKVAEYHIIEMKADHLIPFCEYFIIPYLLWFAYIAVTITIFTFLDRKDFIRLCLMLGIGMTVFLAISYVIPNMQPLRPHVFPRDNIFTDMVKTLYATDTNTNVLPSIHVYNSIVAATAICKAKQLEKFHGLRIGSNILCILIVLSTMFLKQHSVYDVLTAIAMATALYWLVYYQPEAHAEAVHAKEEKLLKGIIH